MSARTRVAKHKERVKRAKKGKSRKPPNACNKCGRKNAYMRDFGLCRICFRELAHKGELPGVVKSSW